MESLGTTHMFSKPQLLQVYTFKPIQLRKVMSSLLGNVEVHVQAHLGFIVPQKAKGCLLYGHMAGSLN